MSTEPYLSAGAVAKAVGIGRETVRQMTLRGIVTAYYATPNGRRLYLESEVRAAIAARTFSPQAHAMAAAELAVLRHRASKAAGTTTALP